jgi:hypothetical protein
MWARGLKTCCLPAAQTYNLGVDRVSYSEELHGYAVGMASAEQNSIDKNPKK